MPRPTAGGSHDIGSYHLGVIEGVSVPSLQTERLLLRGWQEADLEPFAAMNADPRVTEFLSTQLTRDESDALVDRFVSDWADDGFGLWAIERLEDGVLLGFTGLARPRFEAHFTPAVEVGWRLATAAWGHGYATEAAEAALQYGFEVISLGEIVSFTVPANARSRAVMERIGMSRDPADDFNHPRLPEGHRLRHHVLYRLSRDGWRARVGLDDE
jgi:RimJ/RimL family protein N-acetyltransferase